MNIPKHWEIKKLGEVCEKITNGSSAKQFDEKVGYPISRIETIWNQEIDIERVKYVIENDEDFINKYSLQYQDILFSHINSDVHLGKTAMYKSIPKVLIHGINLLLLRVNSIILPNFFNYYLKYLRAKGVFISIAQKSVNQSSINQAKLKNIDIILPPLQEQQAIVAKIEELLSDLENGKQQLLKAQQQLKVYRQSLLKWAFEGKLTNINVKEGELPEGWKWVKLGELFEESPQNGLYKPSSEYGSGIRIMRIDGFYEGKILGNYDFKRVRLTKEEIDKYSLELEDILINRVNSMSHLGKCGLVTFLSEKTVFESNIMRVKIDRIVASSKYITFYLASSFGIKELIKNAKHAVNQASINQTDVSNTLIPLSPLSEQQQIVEILESKLTVCDKLEETISQSLTQSETLRQSILKRAFEGRLV